MLQAVIPRYGAPDVFEMRTGPDPTPGEGEIRIRVRAAGVNFADVLARLGLYPDAPKPPMVVGYEVVGYVDGIGRAVTGFSESRSCVCADAVRRIFRCRGGPRRRTPSMSPRA